MIVSIIGIEINKRIGISQMINDTDFIKKIMDEYLEFAPSFVKELKLKTPTVSNEFTYELSPLDTFLLIKLHDMNLKLELLCNNK